MARFRLKDKHYLNVPGTTWEHQETDQQTGARARKVFEVPLYLNPDDARDCNYPGEIIVATKKDTRFPRDILFTGLPTPDMEPLDDEAVNLYEDYMKRFGGQHPIESLQATGFTYSETLLENLQRQVADLMAKASTNDTIAALQRQVTDLTKKLEMAQTRKV